MAVIAGKEHAGAIPGFCETKPRTIRQEACVPGGKGLGGQVKMACNGIGFGRLNPDDARPATAIPATGTIGSGLDRPRPGAGRMLIRLAPGREQFTDAHESGM